MNKSNTAYVIYNMELFLSAVFSDAQERMEVIEWALPQVITDIEETADENFNDSDIRIALARVLYNKIMNN